MHRIDGGDSCERELSALSKPLTIGDPPGDPPDKLNDAVEAVRCRVTRLAYRIILREYIPAWCEACDLRRALGNAERVAYAVLMLPDAAPALRPLNDVRAVALSVLQLAPAPSVTAIQQASCCDPGADRSALEREREQWLVERMEYTSRARRLHHQLAR